MTLLCYICSTQKKEDDSGPHRRKIKLAHNGDGSLCEEDVTGEGGVSENMLRRAAAQT